MISKTLPSFVSIHLVLQYLLACLDTEDTGVLLEGCSRETLIQQQDQYDATAISKSSAVPSNMSAEMCRPCYDTDSVAAVVGDCETVAQSTLSNNAQAIPAADHVICASVDSAELVPVELYIQGNSQTVFLLFMRQGCLSELDVVRDVVGIFCLLFLYKIYDSMM